MDESRLDRESVVEPASPAVRREAAAKGLYRPEKESDACGVGFVATLRGERTHSIVTQALTVLENLEHRGAAASDPLTGDGAGILIQIPHELLAEECAKLEIPLGAPGTYGLGMLFLPRDEALRAEVIALIERVVAGEDQVVLGWREVPVQVDKAGPAAQKTMPHVAQLLIGPGTLPSDDAALDRKLYVIRKRIENESRRLGLREEEYPYFASLSTRTVVYKGLLTPEQLPRYYTDLADARTTTALALVHQRFSTNTFPSWSRAHPYRRIAHNGEINTLRGNVNWMKAREPVLQAPVFGEDVQKLLPIIDEAGSDSAMFDDVLELLVHTGRSLPHAMMMMIPEAWQQHQSMEPVRRSFYEYHSCVMEPWDGPACIAFTDGRFIGATLDRNGLRPARYVVTKDGLVVMASEVGVLDVAPENVAVKNRLQPGRMLLVDTKEGRIVDDAEIKQQVASRRPYGRWVGENMVRLGELEEQRGSVPPPIDSVTRRRLQRAWGYTEEELRVVLAPMAALGEEAIGSMGNDTPPAVLSDRPQLLYSYFRQLFAQVTNPPIDPIREQLVMSLVQCLGPESNLFVESPLHAQKLQIESPILSEEDLEKIRALDQPGLRAHTIGTTFDAKLGIERALLEIQHEAEEAVRQGSTLLILSDRGATKERAAIPALLALCAVHRHLVDAGIRQRCGLIVESGEPREVMHFCLLIGYGAGAVCPWMAYDSIAALHAEGLLAAPSATEQVPVHKVLAKYRKALEKGLLKVMSKMGISTIQSYRGAQIFEALGLSAALVDRFFAGTPTHVDGIDVEDVERETLARHEAAYAKPKLDVLEGELDPGGSYQFRRDGERHAWNPGTIAMLQHAVRGG